MEMVPDPAAANDRGLLKFRMWCLSPFEMLQKQAEFKEQRGELLI